MRQSLSTRLSAVAFGLIALAGVCFAQGSRGSITGRVTDPQNAVVPGAPVVVKSVLSGETTKTATNQTGYYEVNFLDPGTYSVSIEAPGFKTTIRSGIVLETGDRLSIDMHLEVGAASQSIEVTSQAPLVDTTSAGGDRVLDDREIAQLPYTTMNPFSLQAITPGVDFTGPPGIARVFDNAGTASYGGYGLVAGGGIIAGNEFLLDGAPVTGTNGGRAGFVPSSQALSLIHISEPTRQAEISYAVFCLKKKKK